MKNVKVIIASLVENGEIAIKSLSMETQEVHTGEDILASVFTFIDANNVVPLALITDDTRLMEAWEVISKESSGIRATKKATCSDSEYEQIKRIEENIEEANAMLREEMNKDNTLLGGNDMNTEELDNVINATFEEVEAELKEMASDIESAQEALSEQELKQIFKSKDRDAYKILLAKLDIAYERTKKTFGDHKLTHEVEKRNNTVKTKIDAFLSKHSKTKNILAVVGGLIRKLAAVALGIAKFAFETITLLAAMVVRVGFVITEEVVDTTLAIGGSFNKNVIGLFRRKK